jgi:hypothetical protein
LDVNQVTNLIISVDGVIIKIDDKLMAQSKLFTFGLRSDNVYDAPAGTYQATTEGYQVPLKL